MPFADSRGVRIHYELEGDGPALALMHGFSGNRTSWRGYGFVDALKGDYQLILIDARGHGESDKPHAPEAYDHRRLVDDMIAVLDDGGWPTTHYLGYSMGGMTGFGLARYYPDRLRSLIAGGVSPFNRDDPNARDELLEIYEVGVAQGVEAFVTRMRAWAGAITPAYEARLRSADLHAGVAQLRWRQAHRPDYAGDLATMALPVLLYAGEADEPTSSEAREAAAQLPNARFVVLPGLNHVGAAGARRLIVPQIKQFLATTP
ncbi:MAG TPA: alpha/beta fold hydrolase [Roseiflexaceae bacterium]